MDKPSQSVRNLARRLLVLEAGNPRAHDAHVDEAVRVFDKLRISLARFAGPDGFISLLRRALALARTEHPALQSVRVNAEGAMEGLEQVVADESNGGAEAAVAITAHLLGLLVTFVGEPMTLRLVRDAWPDAALSDNVEE